MTAPFNAQLHVHGPSTHQTALSMREWEAMLADLTETTYGTVLKSLPIGVCVVTPNRRTLVWNDGAEKLTGYTRQEVIGLCCADNLLTHRDETQVVPCGGGCLLQQTIHDAKPRESSVFMRHKHGHRVPVLVWAVALRDHGSIVGAAQTFDLCTSRSAPVLAPLTVTSTDDLTELPDCDPVVARVVACLDEFALSHIPFVVLSMTIDDLEHLRYVDGRIAAVAIVCVAAETLASNIGPRDVVGRWADDRFAAIVDECTRESLVQAAEMWKHFVCLCAAPWWGGRIAPVLSAPGARVQIGDTPEKMTVRTPDANLASTLREKLPALSARLAESGLKSEAWHPAASSTNERRYTAESSAGGASQDANSQPRQQDREPQDGADQRRPQSSQVPIPQKQKGSDFAWLMSSLR